MRPETNRRFAFVSGSAVCGSAVVLSCVVVLSCLVMLSCASGAFAQASDAPRMTGTNVRPHMWATSDPLKDGTWQPIETAPAEPEGSAPAAKSVPMGDTVSVRNLQLPSGAIKEFRRSEKCVGSGDFSCAVQHLQKALKADPQFVEAHNNLGASYLQLSRYQDAIGEFEAAIALDEKMAAPYRNMSLALFSLRRYAEAEAAARKALTLSPQQKAAQYSLGRALAAEGSASPEAEQLLRGTLNEFADARLSLAQVLMNRCANLDAAAELRTYLDSNAVEPETRRKVQVWIDLSSKGQVVSSCAEGKPAT
jgi:thioredoxin-like negative regulator of GroEL